MSDTLPSNVNALPSNVNTLPSNVSIISTEMVETRKMMAGVQTVSCASPDDSGTDVVGAVSPESLAVSARVQNHQSSYGRPTSTLQTDRQTDGRTDRQTTQRSNLQYEKINYC